MTPQPQHERMAARVLKDFVNDHNEVVRWLRNQDPYQVAEALSQALQAEKERVWAAAVGVVEERSLDNELPNTTLRNTHRLGWNAARANLLQAAKDDGVILKSN